MALLVQTNRLKGAVASSSLCDLVADSTHTAGGETACMAWNVNGLGGTLWDVRDRHIESSPVLFMDRVETPVLLMC